MQFVYVLISVIALALLVWWISKRMRLGARLKFDTVTATASSQEQDGFEGLFEPKRDYAIDDVELGPVVPVSHDSEKSPGDDAPAEVQTEEESVSTVEPAEPEINIDSEDSEADDEQPDELDRDIPFVGSVDDTKDWDQALANLGYTAETTQTIHNTPEIEDSGPYFGEYSKDLSGSARNEFRFRESRQPTELKVPESGHGQPTAKSADETAAETSDPVQTELEINVVFPDYRNSEEREIDVLGWLPEAAKPVKRMDVLTIYRRLGIKPEQPHAIIGLDVDRGSWNNLDEDSLTSSYSDLILSMQLSYRGRPITERDWWMFTTMVEKIAEALSRSHHYSMTTDTVIQEAQELSERVRELDLQAILILKSDHDGEFSGKSISYLAREYGMQQRQGTTVYDRFDTESPGLYPLFSMVPMNEANVLLAKQLGQDPDMRTMILFTNLTCVRDPRAAFDVMIDIAQDLEDRLAVRLVDQNHRHVDARSIKMTQSQIDDFIRRMNDCGIKPGSQTATRLFEASFMVQDWAQSQGVVSLKPER